MKRFLLLVLVASLLSFCQAAIAAPETQAISPPPVPIVKKHLRTAAGPASARSDGWWIRVSRDKQESPTISFFIGSNNHAAEYWTTWDSGDPAEFDVPAQYRNINPLYLKAQSSRGRNSWFCLMYKGAGVKHFDFDDDEDHEEKQANRDDECR